MGEETQLIIETTDRILRDLCLKEVVDAAENGQWPAGLWQTLEDNGLTLAGIEETSGGTGGSMQDSLEVIRRCGFYAAPVPLAETFVAATLIQEAGGEVPLGPMTVAPGQFEIGGDISGGGNITIKGHADEIFFADWCDSLLCIDGDRMVLVSRDDIRIEPGKNMAGEPVSHIKVFREVEVAENRGWELPGASDRMQVLGALVRSYQMSGALESILQMSVQYTSERQQFGRPISKFQAIQHQLAIVAGEVAAAGMAADRAGEMLDLVHIATAKSRAGEAAGIAVEITHQVHGAIGYTLEHGLNLRTRRLLDWREGFGNETWWNLKLGEVVCQQGGEGLWPFVSRN